MNRRKLFAWLGGGIAFATAGGLAIAKAAPALSAQHKLAENFGRAGKQYWCWGVQELDGTRFETWKTPNGYVNISTVPKMDLHEKYDAIVWYDEHFLPVDGAAGQDILKSTELLNAECLGSPT